MNRPVDPDIELAALEPEKEKLWKRIHEMPEDVAKDLLMYTVARWAEYMTPKYTSMALIAKVELANANALLDEGLENRKDNVSTHKE